MEISYQWLQEFIELPEAPDVVGQHLTATGLEVEGIEKIEAVPGGLAGVVLGEVLTCERHPDADKLSLTTVDVGGPEPLAIVCGAPNVAAGQKVLVATVGTTLYPTQGEKNTGVPAQPLPIKKTKIRGAVSEGMLCAEDELGLGPSHDGILVVQTELPNGTPAARYFNLEPDFRISIGLTPNRADAASHYGVARDLKAALRRPLRLPAVDAFAATQSDAPIRVRVDDPAACPRYCGLTISGLRVAESPDWLKARLRSIGLSPINNVVDVTNYVLHALGQPLHAFDADQITTGNVVVRTLPAGTPFTTLDGVVRTLTATDLMICNGDDEPMCIAGVFGGKTSGVTAGTTRIFLESAHFSPASVRRTAQHHGLKTDASFRFERGTDPNLPPFALRWAALLLREVAGSADTIFADVVDVYPQPVGNVAVPVRYRNIDRLIGMQLERSAIHRILTDLDIQVTDETDAGFTAQVPPYRVDVTREADVVEEILRIHGLDNVPLSEHLHADTLSAFPAVDANQLQARVGQALAANGFLETMALSMTRPAFHEAIRPSLPGADVALLNPLSDELSVMRQTLLFSALETLVYNVNRRQRDLKLFEFGKTYHRAASHSAEPGESRYVEQARLSLVMTGNVVAETWQQQAQPVTFHTLAAAVQQVLAQLRVKTYDTQPADPAVFQYGLTYVVNKTPVVSLGLVQPHLRKLVDLKQPVFWADFDWQALVRGYNAKLVFAEVPRFPEVRRDLSLVIDRATTFEQIDRLARQTERKLLRAVNVFDVYEGEKLGAGKKAYSVSFTLQDPTQTLTDATIDKTMQRLMAAFERELGALIRK